MKDLAQLLRIRILQLVRLLASVGWPLLVLGIPFIIIILLGIYERSKGGYYLAVIFGMGLISTHYNRKDKFSLSLLGYQPRLVFITEYTIVAVLIGGLHVLLIGEWHNFLALMISSVLIGILPQRTLSHNKRLFFFPSSWVSAASFEWRTGIRKYGWGLALVALLTSSLTYNSPLFPIVGMILIYLMTTSFYKNYETYAMFDHSLSPLQFLLFKLKSLSLFSTVICLPMIISFLVFYYELWYLLLVVMLFGFLVNAFAIFYKYAFYHPSRRVGQGDLAVSIFSVSTLIPFFVPVCLVYLTIYSRRAFNNLTDLHVAN